MLKLIWKSVKKDSRGSRHFISLYIIFVKTQLIKIMEMQQLVADFTNQLREAIEIGESSNINNHSAEIKNVVISGLGGSGIGADLVGAICADQLKVPFNVNKGYFAPKYIDPSSLVLISSYSGNTEETLNVLEEVKDSGAKVCAVSSNGKVIEVSKERSFDHIQIPGGKPPRACLGYSFVQQLYVLNSLGLINDSFKSDLKKAIELLDAESDNIKAEAMKLSNNLNGKIPVLYVEDRMEAVAVRWRQQINENSKMLCWHHVVPEMNHNELVGWRIVNHDLAVVFLRNNDDFSRNQQRMELNKEVMKDYTPHIFDVFSKGESMLEKALYLIHLGDWLSVYLASELNMDAVEVKVIDKLKSSLASMEW